MRFAAYRRVLGNPLARTTLLLGVAVRTPVWAANVALTLHVVNTLHRSYTAAGAVTTVATVGLAISAPWRGRRVDQVGLRRALLPSLLVLPVAWALAPFLGFWVLLPVVFVGSLFTLPSMSVIRQVLLSAVDDADRTTVLALDSVFVEISFMIGPLLGVLGATYWSTVGSLLLFQALTIAAGVLLWAMNPPVRRVDETLDAAAPRLREWLGPVPLAILGASAVATMVLTACDLGAVAALRAMGRQATLGGVLAIWALGSALGGLVYGVAHRRLSAFVLVALLSLVTMPVALAQGPYSLAGWFFVAGLFCAPTITATLDHLTRVVPTRVRGEAMGWHGSALTVGSAIGAPLVGVAIDHADWRAGFLLAGVVGLAVASVGHALVVLRRRRRARVS